MAPLRKLNGRFTHLAIVSLCIVGILWFFTPSDVQRHISIPEFFSSRPKGYHPRPNSEGTHSGEIAHPKVNHPIDYLIRSADHELDDFLVKETKNIHDAAQAYRERRGRQPPPGFDLWFAFAQQHSALIVEDFFDQIYHDLNPFWGISAKEIREPANTFASRISVRNGVVAQRSNGQQPEWLKLWANLTQTFAEFLPDVDIAVNEMDESRMVVEWEEINEYMERAKESRRIVPEVELKDEYQSLKYLDDNPPDKFSPQYVREGSYWEKAVVGCPPDSPAKKYRIETDFTAPPPLTGAYPEHSYEGYVRNWTLSKSPCDNPRLQGLHGTFIEPVSMAHTRKFFPLFGGSKLSVNNEILLPPAMYWTHDPFYSGGDYKGDVWEKKKDEMVWRGAASGGRNRKNNWTRFQRHRFVSMVNATSILAAEEEFEFSPPNFVLPKKDSYRLAAFSEQSKPGALSEWVKSWSDVKFVHLLCFPPQKSPKGKLCKYTDPYFSITNSTPMREQYDYKYIPDVDGNSYSGRWRGFLGSTSLPIKATIYNEWHDSRLIPWKHFVPMDNTFVDVYGIMEYFLGNKEAGVRGHDDTAKRIALDGKHWAERVLRREDMQIYMFRLLLEYARLCDDDRETMGWKESKRKKGWWWI